MTRLLLIIAISCVATAPVEAQLLIETGGGHGQLDQMPSSSLTALGGSLDQRFGLAHLQLGGATQDHVGLGVAGVMNGTLHAQLTASGWHIEAGPSVEAARDIGAPWAKAVAGDVAISRNIGHWQLAVSGQQGFTQIGAQQRTAWTRPGLSAGVQLGALSVGTSWQMTTIQDSVLRNNAFLDPGQPDADTLFTRSIDNIQDVSLRAGWHWHFLSFDATVARRFGLNIAPETTWEGNAAIRVTPTMAVMAHSGRLASDEILGLRGGRYTTVGLRVDLLHNAPESDTHDSHGALAEIARESLDAVRVTFVLPPATRQATLSGDLTDWRPVAMVRQDDGRWSAVLTAHSGVYRLNVSLDDGPWHVPPGLPAVDDGFGTQAGLLVIDQ